MTTVEYIMKDRKTGAIGRYQFAYDDEAELMKILDLDMLLTVPEMVDCVIGEFTSQDLADFLALKKDELLHLHHSIGQDIRNAFGLWVTGNPNIDDCADDTSMEVIQLIWWKLQNSGGISGSTVMEFA